VKFVKFTVDGRAAWVETTGGPVLVVREQTDGTSLLHFADGAGTTIGVAVEPEEVVKWLEEAS
jgi:hypothetical protein